MQLVAPQRSDFYLSVKGKIVSDDAIEDRKVSMGWNASPRGCDHFTHGSTIRPAASQLFASCPISTNSTIITWRDIILVWRAPVVDWMSVTALGITGEPEKNRCLSRVPKRTSQCKLDGPRGRFPGPPPKSAPRNRPFTFG